LQSSFVFIPFASLAFFERGMDVAAQGMAELLDPAPGLCKDRLTAPLLLTRSLRLSSSLTAWVSYETALRSCLPSSASMLLLSTLPKLHFADEY
jgi:hypothetical protein